MVIYIEYPKKSTKIIIELTHAFSKVKRYQITTQKSITFPLKYINIQKPKLKSQSHL